MKKRDTSVHPSWACLSSDDELREYTNAANGLGFLLFGHQDPDRNLVVSPASIHLALAMLWRGARARTAVELSRALGSQLSPEIIERVATSLLRRWNGSFSGGYELSVVNRLFTDPKLALEPDYQELTERVFAAQVGALRISPTREVGRAQVNQWVEEQTNGRITDLLPPGSITEDTRALLANAVYFLADWEQPFQKERTDPTPFWVNATYDVDVPTMRQTGYFRYGEGDTACWLELPYMDGHFSMVIALPRERDGWRAVESALDARTFASALAAMEGAQVKVSLPKFQFETGSLDLKRALTALGVTLAFDALGADFSGISKPDDPRERLYLSDVFHKALISVDEKGTEAAAATALSQCAAGGPVLEQPEPRSFVVDHPFLFWLRDTETGAVLFMGRVVDPDSDSPS